MLEQATVVVPSGNAEPEAGEQVTRSETSTMSVVVAEKVTVADPVPVVASAVMSAGRCNAGGVVSRTVTVEEAEPRLPAASVAVHVTVVVPNGKIEPGAGEQLGDNDPLTVSTAVAENVATAPVGPVASRITGNPDIKTDGDVVSRTTTWNEPVARLPEWS